MRRRVCSILAGVAGVFALSVPPALAAPGPIVGARAATLVAPGTGQQLYALNASAEQAIASTTKLMTALVTLEHAPMQEVFAYPGYPLAAADSQIGLARGERMTVHDLFVAMLLPSADDAAYDLAYNIGHGSVPRFVGMMNKDARRLGLAHTHYATPIGFDTPGNYSSASDLVTLAGYLLDRYPLFAQIVGLPSAVLRSGNHVRSVVNRNDLVGRYGWIHGVKTGHTLQAGYVLVAAARRSGFLLLSAVLGTGSEAARDQNTLALLGWGYANFRLATPITEGTVVARPSVSEQPGLHAVVVARSSLTRVVPRGGRIRVRVELRRPLAGPLARGTVVGHAIAFADGQRIGAVPLVLARAIPAVSALTRVERFLTRASTLVLLAVLASSGVVLIVRRRQHGRVHRTPA
jgi:D-alanyl-D-alanine carboxypeptidase (penicillin-binding protein 5/6)